MLGIVGRGYAKGLLYLLIIGIVVFRPFFAALRDAPAARENRNGNRKRRVPDAHAPRAKRTKVNLACLG